MLVSAFKTPLTLEGMWRNSAAFLVGSGPSLQRDDPRFNQRGVVSLGINNAAALVQCSAMVFTDPAKKMHHNLLRDPRLMKLCPRTRLNDKIRTKINGEFRWTKTRVKDCPNVFGFTKTGDFEPEEFLSQDKVNIGVDREGVHRRKKCIFTMFAGLKLLYHFGVRRVYLAGMDFHMPYNQHYCHGRQHCEDFRLGNQEKYVVVSRMLAELKPRFDKAGFHVFNTYRKSRLTVFPYVPIERAFEDCVIPARFDLDGWYDNTFIEGVYGGRGEEDVPEMRQTV